MRLQEDFLFSFAVLLTQEYLFVEYDTEVSMQCSELGMGRTWEKSELFSNFFVNISTFKVRPCFASPGKIPQIPQNEQKYQRHRSVWVGHDKFLKIG